MATLTRAETQISTKAMGEAREGAHGDARASARVTSQHASRALAPDASLALAQNGNSTNRASADAMTTASEGANRAIASSGDRSAIDSHSMNVTRERLPIIAFAKDWHEDPTSNHHVLRELAKSRRVLWLNSLATRTPSLASGRDLGKIKRKLGEFAKGPINVENDLWVFSPLVLPLPHQAWARHINQRILRATIRALRWRLGIDQFQLWTFLPTSAEYVGALGEQSSVYYCVDEWSMFSYLDRQKTVAAERELLGKVDVVFGVTHALADAKRALNPETHVSPHGVDHALFAKALDDATPVPADIAEIRGPRIGFYGTLRDWVDLELIAHVAKAKPTWSIVLLGQVLTDITPIADLPNVHLLGQKRHDELPGYCKAFDVGLIPYRIDERMPFVNPLKLREYLSAGLPVVSTPVPEVLQYRELCRIASTPGELVQAIEAALREGGMGARGARSAAMKNETWSARVADVMRVVDEISHAKEQRKGR